MESARAVTFFFVMDWREMLGIIVRTVVFAGCPIKVELLLGNAVFEPVVPHIESL